MAARVVLPTFHSGQVAAFQARTRFQVLRCGRRWGKTDYSKIIGGDRVCKGQNVGIFVPNYKILTEVYNELAELLRPVERSSNKSEMVFRASTDGRIDFWSLENDRAGRSRKYDLVIIDEAAFTKPNMLHLWNTAIKPTLLDRHGQAIAMSTPNGINDENFFYQICTQPKHGFTEYHAPTSKNPYMPEHRAGESEAQYQERRRLEFESLKAANHPLVYRQEYLAEFVDWSGVAFFQLDKLLVEGQPVPVPQHIDYVFATIDTAMKDGKEHDGTAVVYCGVSKYVGHPLTILDWDIVQIQGSMLEVWLPTVFQNLEALSAQTKARFGKESIRAYIEDKSSGTILLQQAANRGWPAEAIDSELTNAGKDARALSISGYVYQGLVKLSQPAFDKVVMFKGNEKNHLISQVMSFTPADKKAATRSDDLLDAFCYSVAVALGNPDGY